MRGRARSLGEWSNTARDGTDTDQEEVVTVGSEVGRGLSLGEQPERTAPPRGFCRTQLPVVQSQVATPRHGGRCTPQNSSRLGTGGGVHVWVHFSQRRVLYIFQTFHYGSLHGRSRCRR